MNPRAAIVKSRAYPRWRGGNLLLSWPKLTAWGLSPLARGKRLPVLLGGIGEGPIPAGAGETWAVAPGLSAGGAHPRWRGGNKLAPFRDGWSRGPSPLARGKLRAAAAATRTQGPIPAGAGETDLGGGRGEVCRAHPRWRGGN